jgi:NADH dehydrogenase/NADH:ubiquinone oxidoreductase subunit G
VTAGGPPKLVPACAHPVSGGLAVETNSPRVRRGRGIVIELLLSRAPSSAVLRFLADEYGVTEPRFQGPKHAKECILCGLCSRVCQEHIGTASIGFTRRGVDREVTPPFDESSQTCLACGACVHVCPLRRLRLQEEGGRRRIEEWHVEVPLRTCRLCGRGFVSERLAEYMRNRQNVPEELTSTCLDCRGKNLARELIGAAADDQLGDRACEMTDMPCAGQIPTARGNKAN